MRAYQTSDLWNMPADSLNYTKSLLVFSKWVPATLIALFTGINQLFGTLFWLVGILWFCDFFIGTTRVWVDDSKRLEWGKSFRSVIKLLVMGVGVIAIHMIEKLIFVTGVNLQGKLTGAILLVMGTTEAISVLDNLTYFFPQIDEVAKKIKELLEKARNESGSDT
jgi:phage-related holin